MADNKMISIEKMDEILNDRFPVDMVADYYGEELIVHRFIPYTAQCELVRDVVDACFSDKGEYMPEVREFAFRIYCIAAYTNVRLPEDNIEHQYRIIFHSDLWDVIKTIVPTSQLDNLKNSIQERIDVRNNANRTEFEYTVNKVTTSLEDLSERLNGLFGNITEEKFNALIDAVSTGGVDEQKLVQAVLGARSQNED